MYLNIGVKSITGLGTAEMAELQELIDVFNYHEAKNAEKAKYYEGNISLREVNLGLALPDGMSRLEIGCAWGSKTVDVLASRSMFDGFVDENGGQADEITEILINNRLIAEYMKAARDELKYGCTFATVFADPEMKSRIRFHSPRMAAGLWDGVKGRIRSGLAIIDGVTDEKNKGNWQPTLLHMHTDTAVWEIYRVNERWYARRHPHKMGRPLMEPLVWNPTADKPFGRSRLKEPIRRLIQGYVRTIANATIGLEFSTAPQKYLLGVTDDQYDVLINQKFRQYVGSMMVSTLNPETNQNPSFGQLAQGSIEPHVQMVRVLATQFSAATGLTVTDTGVVNDANPTSSDAILAQSQTLISMAEQLNTANGDSLRMIALMALAVANNSTIEELPDDQKKIVAHFKNPAMPSVSATADAAIKIATSRQEFAQTDVFLEMLGFDQADIRRINAQEQRVRGRAVLEEIQTIDEEEEVAENTEA